MLDTQSLAIALFLIQCVGCALHVVNWRIHKHSPGPKWWTIGLCLHTLGVMLAIIHESVAIDDKLTEFLDDYLLVGGTLVLLYGTARFAGRSLPPAIYVVLALYVAVGTAWFSLVDPSITLRLTVFTTAAITANGLILGLLIPIARRDGPMGVIVLASAIVCLALLLGGLLVQQLTRQPELTSLYEDSRLIPMALLSLIAFEATSMFGYLLLSACHSQARLERLALSDPLTGLPNRRAFEAEINQRLDSARRNDRQIALALFDIDHFKQVNDIHGHDVGDRVLRHLGQVTAEAVRPHDFIARVGGEEFAIIFDVEDVDELVLAADRLRLAVASSSGETGDTTVAITVSVGAVIAETGLPLAYGGLYRAADRALYQAKADGRNRVVIGEVDALQRVA